MGLRRALRLVDASATVAASMDSAHGGPGYGYAYPRVAVGNPEGLGQLLTPDGMGIGRAAALSVPAFRQGVSMIAGTAGTFPFRTVKDRRVVPDTSFIAQPDPDEAPSITWTRLYEDLVLFPYAWLKVTSRYAPAPGASRGYPRTAVFVPFEQVTVDEDRRVWVNGEPANAADMLRFDSPNAPGALVDGASLLTTCLKVEAAVRRYADMTIPAGYLKQTAGPDMSDTEITDLLDGWDTARARRSTGFLNGSLDYETVQWNAEQLQLVQARDANAVDVARLLNLPPMAVNADQGGSLTYSTTESQGRQLVNTTLNPYLASVSGRLSMPDITVRGSRVEASLDAFLRSDAEARARVYPAMIGAGVLTIDEARALEGLPPLEG